jgi:hypothetical protein
VLTIYESSTTNASGAPKVPPAAPIGRKEQAMTAENLARAKAVCGFNFDGSNLKWCDISLEMKMEACIQLALEFKGEDWAIGRIGSLYMSMLKWIVDYKHNVTVGDDSYDDSTVERNPRYASCSSVVHSFLTDSRDSAAAGYFVDLDGDTTLEMAMTPANLERAKAVCEIEFSGRHRGSKTLTPEMKMEACIQMALEFQEEVWATRKMGPVIISMLNRVVEGIAGSGPNSKAARTSTRSKGTVADTYVAAMNEQNLARAKAVCGLNFDGPMPTWVMLTLAEQTNALWQLGLEFKDDDWARGRMNGIFREMITRIMDDHNRRFDQIQEPNHTVDTRRNAINEKAHTVLANQPWGFADPRR